MRDPFCGRGSWRGKEAWLCQLIDWVRLLGHSNGNTSHFRLCQQVCFVSPMVYIWTLQLSLQCSRFHQESSTPFVYRRRAGARPSHHDSLAWKAFWLKVESLKSFSHATGVDCFETITIACPVLSSSLNICSLVIFLTKLHNWNYFAFSRENNILRR